MHDLSKSTASEVTRIINLEREEERRLLKVNGGKELAGVSAEKAPRNADALTGLAGRELDAAVATHVMNIACSMDRTPDHSKWCNRHGMGERVGAPFYSRDIDRAMEVVEKMRSDGWSFACTLYEGKLPYASFCKGTAASSRNAEAETLPEAICRAALQATASVSALPTT